MRYLVLALLMLCTSDAGAKERRLVRDGRVVAHGLQFDPQETTAAMPPALRELLRAYRTQPRYATPVQGPAVPPLLQSTRHQDAPYNICCPYYTYADGRVSETRCISGCVATSIEQVLTYWRYPVALADTLHGWETDHYVITDILPGTTIDWDNILTDYTATYTDRQAMAVAELTYYCGMAAHMSWGVSSSGANLRRAAEPLERVFGYKTVHYAERCFYTPEGWNRILRNELENGRPICYTGHNMAMSGHAFNIDGVDADGLYHVNWGYGGAYDGYFDLDYLNPFEPAADPTETGQQEGFFCNQTALLLHPANVDINLADSLPQSTSLHGVAIEQLQFRRQPDTQGYVLADLTLRNTTPQALCYTLELMTYLPTDTAIFRQADYVAISTVTLQPGERRTAPLYCQFSKTGDRILALSTDDETLEWQQPITIETGTTPKLEFSEIDCQIIRYADDITAQITVDVTNLADTGTAGDLVTFCLFAEDQPDDLRHWQILTLPAGQTQRLTTTFHNLALGHNYQLLVRCPWEILQQLNFLADNPLDALPSIPPPTLSIPAYNLQGHRVGNGCRGVVIRDGKKFTKR